MVDSGSGVGIGVEKLRNDNETGQPVPIPNPIPTPIVSETIVYNHSNPASPEGVANRLMSQNMFDAYRELLQKIDAKCDEIFRACAGEIQCRKGCSGCCRQFSIFPVEAFHIRQALARMVAEPCDRALPTAEQPPKEEGCPFLAEDACAIYDVRPVICRTQGMPLMTRIQGENAITCCPENFRSTKSFPAAVIFDLERLNQLLVAVNRLFIESSGREALPDRIPLSEIATIKWPTR